MSGFALVLCQEYTSRRTRPKRQIQLSSCVYASVFSKNRSKIGYFAYRGSSKLRDSISNWRATSGRRGFVLEGIFPVREKQIPDKRDSDVCASFSLHLSSCFI